MTALPTLRRKILRSFSILLVLYIFLGVLLVGTVIISGRTTPRLIHVNYDSIAAATKMREAWSALHFVDQYKEYSKAEWESQFEKALAFEEGNLTEPGEKEIAATIRSGWNEYKVQPDSSSIEDFTKMRATLQSLVDLNERGMFGIAQENAELSSKVLYGALIYFAISLILSLLFADQLAQRLTRPLKSIAEAIHQRPSFHKRLKLPEPTSLELLILTTELKRLWERLSEADRINVAELLQQKNKLETLLESVEDGLLVIDAQGKVLHVNECMLKLIGLLGEQVRNHFWMDLPTVNENYLKLRAVLREGMPESQEIELLWRQQHSQFSARSRNIDGSPDKGGVLYLLHDITEKRQREKFRAEFIDLLSHELKTPLQSLGTAAEIMNAQKQRVPDDLRLLVETISEDVERIRAVAQEFVQITQSQAKIMKLKLQTIALNHVLPEWIKPFSLVAKDRGVKLEFLHEGSEVIWANLDLVKFPWVISNLVSNAIRFSPKEGKVTLVITDRNGAVEIQVRDQGPGVSETDQMRIFEAFYQAPMTTASGARGLFGVGLTIAKEVVEAHDGRIEYHRLHPRGSEFRILLPFPPLQYRDNQGGA